MRRPAVFAVVVLVAVLVGTVVAPVPAAGAPPPGPRYQPPVDAPIVDGFRLPDGPYGAGNRGIELATTPGTTVGAVADGEVTFAGPVAAQLHVTVLHADGIRSSYSYLDELSVVAGQRVTAGQPVGIAGARLHVGARAGDSYLDPTLLWSAAPAGGVRLVPVVEDPVEATSAAERAHLLGVVDEDGGGGLGARAVAWARDRIGSASHWLVRPTLLAGGKVVAGATRMEDRLGAIGHQLGEVLPVPHLARFVEGLDRWFGRQQDCTPPTRPVAVRPERRVAVLVGGLGSTSDDAAVDDVDTATLGYDPADVVRFSYRGGLVPHAGPAGELTTLTPRPYDAGDTQVDIEVSAARLADLLAAITEAVPGVPVDVLAHSQGGVVTRLALADLAERRPPVDLGAVVTLATPHRGADLATVAQGLDGSRLGAAVDRLRRGLDLAIDPWSDSVTALGETSEVTRSLEAAATIERYDVVSVGARGDLVVPAGRTLLGERSVTVAVGGPAAHDRLPGSPEAQREIALALAGLPVSCERLDDVVADLVTGEVIGWATDVAGLSAAVLSALL